MLRRPRRSIRAALIPIRESMNRPSSSRRQQLIQHWGAILWPSFIAAGVASVVFFAFVDPLRLQAISFPATPISRELGYTAGFFMFWTVTALLSLIHI